MQECHLKTPAGQGGFHKVGGWVSATFWGCPEQAEGEAQRFRLAGKPLGVSERIGRAVGFVGYPLKPNLLQSPDG
jgi:hypothetical protein